MESKGKKRRLEQLYGQIYKFKIILPNGMAVSLRLTNPGTEMKCEDFIRLVKEEYKLIRRLREPERTRPVNWNAGNVYLEDVNDNKLRHIISFANFNPNKIHILRFNDGCKEVTETYENMWDLTPVTDLLSELPEGYTFETALADLIDNSLQAVWSNGKNDRRLISVDVKDDRISIFDTGPGMDNSDENSIEKWGRMGASLHRSSKAQAVGGKPPYLTPYFGMFGYGGPVASMHLGRHALVSSKTKESPKVLTLHLEREALLSNSCSEQTWKTHGGMRNPTENEIRQSPHGSFTKVDISGLKMKKMDILQLRCRLKDIYFPYIQCDDLSNKGKTATPVKFQVNGVDLAEIEGGEVSITNLHSCNGPEFVFHLRFSVKQNNIGIRSPGLRACQVANARLKFAYFPIVEGEESIEKIIKKLEAERCGISENFETFSRVSIRRLGRLLPDARWACLPFMEYKQKKGDKAHLLKRCCSRVKCYIETDAGFNPTPSKTDLAHRNPFAAALKSFGTKMPGKETEVNIEIFQDGKLLNPGILEREYEEWILQMHDRYDEEVGTGEDDAVLVVGPTNKKLLGISSDVIRVHRALKRKGVSWRHGQKIKVLKGACPGMHKANVYATLEYFLIEGLQGDAGGEARIICRPLDVADENGCVLKLNNANARLDIRGSLSLPISVIDSGKCLAIECADWDRQLKKQCLKAPSKIDLLGADHCQELDVDGALPVDPIIDAGQVTPSEIVAVVRPASYDSSSTSNSLHQKYIVKNLSNISMHVKFREQAKDRCVDHIYSASVSASSRKGFDGLYIFSLGSKFPDLFKRAGIYTFLFSLVNSSCEELRKIVKVSASQQVRSWKLLSDNDSRQHVVRVGSSLKRMAIACFDNYNNRTAFVSHPKVAVRLNLHDVLFQIDKVKTSLSSDRLTLEVKDVLIESSELDKLRPTYEATLLICPQDKLDPLSIPCKVFPGSLEHVKARSQLLQRQLLPGFIVKDFVLEMFDAYGNHVIKGLEVQLEVDGFHILDHLGPKRKVDDNGYVDLSGLLKVTASFGKIVSVTVSYNNIVVFKQESRTDERKLRIASEVPKYLIAGSQLENTVFQVVNSDGDVDERINDGNSGQPHTLTIKPLLFDSEDCYQYIFRNGRCNVPVIPIPAIEGNFCLIAAHSHHPDLQLTFNIEVVHAPRLEYDEVQSPCSNGEVLLRDSKSLEHVGNSPSLDNAGKLMLPIVNLVKRLEDDSCKYGQRIGSYENKLKELNQMKAERERGLSQLKASFGNLGYVSTREEIMEHINNRSNSAAAILCHPSRAFSLRECQKHFVQDIVGLVAFLGTVCSDKLSRILAEYLGEDQMCAVVCSSFEAATALEKYNENGEVDRELALHAEAAALGKSISGRFLVICLEDIRFYRGGVEKSDKQKKLALPDPILPSGKIASGFMGYAVNMITIDSIHLDIKTRAGHGLRETLFYRLFGGLQVYETRGHIKAARASIKHGAVSLDGGILRENGILSLGYGNPAICFPVKMSADEMHLSPSMEVHMKYTNLVRELQMIDSEIMEMNRGLEKSEKKLRKSDKYKSFLDALGTTIALNMDTSNIDS